MESPTAEHDAEWAEIRKVAKSLKGNATPVIRGMFYSYSAVRDSTVGLYVPYIYKDGSNRTVAFVLDLNFGAEAHVFSPIDCIEKGYHQAVLAIYSAMVSVALEDAHENS